MKTPLAWCNLTQEKLRTAVATAGVAFALTLVFMQLGFLGSVYNTATLVTDQLDFDIALVSPDYHHVGDPGDFPLVRLSEARSIPGVVDATPFYVGVQLWRSELKGEVTADGSEAHLGKLRPIMVLGYPCDASPLKLDPAGRQFPLRIDARDLDRLRSPDTLLIDSLSHRSFEPRRAGDSAEIGGRRLRIEGGYELGTSFAADGSILVSDQTFASLFPGTAPDRVTLGLLKVDPKRADVEAVATQLREALIGAEGSEIAHRRDVRVMTRSDLAQLEQAYWTGEKAIGLIFLFGVAVALLVGVVVVYQVLASDIMDHYKEYATLKAMGYTDRYLSMVVLQQGLLLSLFGYAPALLAAYGLYWLTRWSQNLPIAMTAPRAIVVLAMSSLMCAAAALFSVRKVTASDPANLF